MLRGSRACIAAMALALLTVPFCTSGQPTKIYRIGWLGSGDAADANSATADFRQGLRDLKYVDGQNVTIEYRHAGGRTDRLADLAAELVRLRVDVIVTAGDSAALAAKRVTNVIPIVATELARDPVKSGLVTSLGRPGGNLTGLATQSEELWEKRIGLLREVAPRISRVAVIWNPGNPDNAACVEEIRAAATGLRLRLVSLEVRDIAALERASRDIETDSAGAAAICWDSATLTLARAIADFGLKQRMPTVAPLREYVQDGALMSFGTSLPAQRRRAAYYVDKILKGTKPADLPIERAALFELVINLTTVKTLGFALPPSLLVLADELIP